MLFEKIIEIQMLKKIFSENCRTKGCFKAMRGAQDGHFSSRLAYVKR